MNESNAANEPDYGAIDVPATPTTDEEIAKLPVLDLDAHKASAARVYHVPASEMYDEPHPNWRTVKVVRVSDFEPAPPQPPGVPSPPKPPCLSSAAQKREQALEAVRRAGEAGHEFRDQPMRAESAAWTFRRYWREVAIPYYRFAWRFWFGR